MKTPAQDSRRTSIIREWLTPSRLLLLLILAAAAWIRLAYRDLNFFNVDESIEAMLELRLITGEVLPLAGPEMASDNAGPLTGPFFYYFLAIPYWLFGDPTAAIAFMNLFGVLAVYLTYRLGNAVFGPPVGLVAAALYAFFPLVVINSGPQLASMPFFTNILLLALVRYVRRREPWMLAATLFLLGLALQIYPGMVIFVVVVPAAMILYKPPIRVGPLVVGVVGAFLLYLPLFIFEAMRDFDGFRRFFSWADGAFGTHAGPAQTFWTIAARAFVSPFSLPPQMGAALPGGELSATYLATQYAELALLGLGIGVVIYKVARRDEWRAHLLLGLWLALPYLIFPFNKVGTYWYTFESVFPAQFLVLGVLARSAWRVGAVWRRWTRPAVAMTTTFLVGTQFYFVVEYRENQARAGVIRFPTDAVLTFPDLLWQFPLDYLEFLTARHVRGLTKAIAVDLGLSREEAEVRVHGRVYEQLREVADYYRETLPRPTPPASPHPAHHYVVLGRSPAHAPQGEHVRAAGIHDVRPYRVVAYEPMIRYAGWKLRRDSAPGWWKGELDDNTWEAVTLPARDLIKLRMKKGVGGRSLAFRGNMQHTPNARAPLLVVSVRQIADSTHRPAPPKWGLTLYANGHAARRVYEGSAVTVWPFAEAWYDVQALLRDGSNLIAFEITGLDADAVVDLYEVSPDEAAAR